MIWLFAKDATSSKDLYSLKQATALHNTTSLVDVISYFAIF